MNSKFVSGTGFIIAAILFVAVNIVSNATLTSWRLDVTDNRLFTLSDGTLSIVDNLEEPIRLRLYFSAKQFSGIPPIVNYGVRVRDLLEEYEAKAHGHIELEVIDPEPFSEAEDQAVAFGVQRMTTSAAGEFGYFGLLGTNTTDDEVLIPFFQPSEERSLEYELTKLIYNLANPTKRVIGIISTLPISGRQANPMAGTPPQEPWAVISMMREIYDVRALGYTMDSIAADIDTLVVIHPKMLPPETTYAIDQFVLRGGKAMLFIDPMAEEDQTPADPQSGMMVPERGSDAPELLQAWGLRMVADRIAADYRSAIRVSNPTPRGPREIEFLLWLQFDASNFADDDFVTNQLNTVNLGTSGVLEPLADAETEFTPLLSTSEESQAMVRDQVMFNRDPVDVLNTFQSGGEPLVLAARIRGHAKSAFPDGKPHADPENPPPADPNFLAQAATPINVIVVADTDILSDRFWVQIQNFLGMRIPSPFADNGTFVINALDNLGGNDALISLRSRGESSRPFDRVEALQREAEAQFRDKEKALQKRLSQTEQQISDLQSQKDEASAMLLSPEQKLAIDGFREEQLKIRKELRAVQHELRKNIERLGVVLKFINIGLVPLLIALIAAILGLTRTNLATRVARG